jgi:hypothetical protein
LAIIFLADSDILTFICTYIGKSPGKIFAKPLVRTNHENKSKLRQGVI